METERATQVRARVAAALGLTDHAKVELERADAIRARIKAALSRP